MLEFCAAIYRTTGYTHILGENSHALLALSFFCSYSHLCCKLKTYNLIHHISKTHVKLWNEQVYEIRNLSDVLCDVAVVVVVAVAVVVVGTNNFCFLLLWTENVPL